jgi:uncharacterized protein
MRLAVLSDTHVSLAEVEPLMVRLRPHLRDVQGILHAGDVGAMRLVDELQAVAPVYAVAGNMDSEPTHQLLPERRVIELAGRRIGLIHGWGTPTDLKYRVVERFRDHGKLEVEVVVFGHSHQPLIERTSEVLLLNPGSPTDRRWAPYRSLAILELGAELRAELVELD